MGSSPERYLNHLFTTLNTIRLEYITMLTKILYLWAALASSVTPSPVSESQLNSRASTTYTARFDDLVPVNILAEIVNSQEIGSYNGLRWQGFCTYYQQIEMSTQPC